MPGDQTFPFENKNKEILDKDVHYLPTFLSLDNFEEDSVSISLTTSF